MIEYFKYKISKLFKFTEIIDNNDDDEYDEPDEEPDEEPELQNGILARIGSKITVSDTVLVATLIISKTDFMPFYYMICGLVIILYAFLIIEIKSKN